MRYKLILFLGITILSISIVSPPAAAVNKKQPTNSFSTTDNKNDSSELTEKKKRLQEDAEKLARDFKTLFKDLSGISKTIPLPFIENVSQWIKDNYAQLNEQGRKKLKNSLEDLNNKLNKLENLSKEKIKKLFKNFQEMLDDLKKRKEKKKIQPGLVPA